MVNTYEVHTPRKGVTQYTFTGHGYILSVGDSELHYADPEKDLVEIALLDKNDKFVPLTSCDNVAGYVPRSKVAVMLSILKTEKAVRSRFHHYFETLPL